MAIWFSLLTEMAKFLKARIFITTLIMLAHYQAAIIIRNLCGHP